MFVTAVGGRGGAAVLANFDADKFRSCPIGEPGYNGSTKQEPSMSNSNVVILAEHLD